MNPGVPNFPNDFNFRVILLPLFSTTLLPFARADLSYGEGSLVFEWRAGFNRYAKLVSYASAKYLIFLDPSLERAFLFMFSRCNRTALSTEEARALHSCRKLARTFTGYPILSPVSIDYCNELVETGFQFSLLIFSLEGSLSSVAYNVNDNSNNNNRYDIC